jgi:tRNA-Thr(GGU) m(6)t(6)A37 methyltransferase TsaA
MSQSISLNPIGIFSAQEIEKYHVARQPDESRANNGRIELFPHMNYEQALQDLDSFQKIWIVFLFHKNQNWKAKVMPPRGGVKRGVFATRSPHRPNPIGISCVDLLSVQGRKIEIANHDLIDGTPVLDIKPYLPYADAHPELSHGWLDTNTLDYELEWSPKLEKDLAFLRFHLPLMLKKVEEILKENPLPYPARRITQTGERDYVLAYKSWRFRYEIKGKQVELKEIFSGYDEASINGSKASKWGDLELHRSFLALERPL